MKEIARGWQEFWAEFFRVKHRQTLKDMKKWDRKLVVHAIETLGLGPGTRLLDLGCGTGDQALEFARMGISVVGVEIAESLVRIGNANAKKAGLPVELIHEDMRQARFNSEFDACTMVNAFAVFDDDGNLEVLTRVRDGLKHGGRFYIYLPNPLHRMTRKWERWDEIDGGHLLMRSNYDPRSSTETFDFFYVTREGEKIVFTPKPEDKGVSVEGKVYTLSQVIGLLKAAGLSLDKAYGSIEIPPEEYSVDSESMILVGTRD